MTGRFTVPRQVWFAAFGIALLLALGWVATQSGPLAPIQVTVTPVVMGEVAPALFGIGTVVSQEIDTQQFDQEYCAQSDCEPYVYDAGSLVVDLVDPTTSTLVWRAWADSAFGPLIDSQPAMERRIEESVPQILASLPSRL